MVQRAERISQFIADRQPDAGAKVQVLCEDHVGTYTLPYLCRWAAAGGWSSATTLEKVEAEVLGWRTPPAAASADRRIRVARKTRL